MSSDSESTLRSAHFDLNRTSSDPLDPDSAAKDTRCTGLLRGDE